VALVATAVPVVSVLVLVVARQQVSVLGAVPLARAAMQWDVVRVQGQVS
jgi:hypothetical protein